MNEDNVESSILGKVASQYYLKYMTVSMFASNIRPDTLVEVFLNILSVASEYDEILVRYNEVNHNEALSAEVPYAVDKNSLDDPHVKTNLLFQAHFSQIELPISDYHTDLKSVLDHIIRVIQAMIDVHSNNGWLSSSVTCMHLLQMVMQGMWFERDSPLRMLPCMTEDLLGCLQKGGISNIQQLLDLLRMNLQSRFENGASKLQQDLQHFPCIQVDLRIQGRVDGTDNIPSLSILLEKSNRRKTSRAFTPRYPKIKDEAWWLVLGNTSTSELHALKRVSFTYHLVTRMKLP